MTYKEFKKWCKVRDRKKDWTWSEEHYCKHMMQIINKELPFKRENRWKQFEYELMDEVINPVNIRNKIKELEEA